MYSCSGFPTPPHTLRACISSAICSMFTVIAFCIAGVSFTAPLFRCSSGSVATVVSWDRYACVLRDARVQPIGVRCPTTKCCANF